MQCLRCRHKDPPQAKFCQECGTPLQHSAGEVKAAPSYADVQRSLTEALDQQTATSEILRVISQSPTDVQPVLDAVTRSAARLCTSYDASVFRLDGEILRLVAHHGPVRVPSGFVMPTIRGLVGGRAVLDRRPIQAADLQMQTEEFPEGSAITREHGFHTLLSVPLLREGAAIGIIALRRIEVQPFTEAQIALLQTFADQAVIAIENVRLFNETKEGLERQTATADILRVIGSSPTDVQPVFDAIARSGVSVCAALGCAVFAIEGDIIRLAATHGVRPERLERFRQEYPAPLDTKIDTAQTIRERRVFHLADIEHNPNATASDVENARLAGYRTRLMVPMVRGDRALGLIAVTREAPTPFSDQQVALLKTFADQAVIAIENVRLFKELEGRNRELTEALEQQTATSEILGVISSSPIDTQPVFDTIARNALRLCEGSSAIVSRYDGELMHLAAHAHVTSEGVDHIVRTFPMRPSWTSMHGRAVLEGTVVHVRDVRADLEYDQRISQALQNRSSLAVPMLRDGRPVGAIAIGRYEVRPFTDTQIALLQTFADQAVIAIENVRLFKELEARNRELTEALEQQTATSEILGVISSSPTDVTPVFDAICRSAVRLLGAHQGGVFRFDGKLVHIAALTSLNPEAEGRLRMRFPQAPNPHAGSGRAIVEKRVFQIPDTEEFPFEGQRATARDFGFRRSVWVPMIREEQVIGVLSVNGREPGPYSEREIALLQTFADQAVIALENVRLFTELQTSNRDLTTALNTQTATSDILRVISRSQTDVQPVFDAIVTSAVRLLEGYSGVLTRVEGDQIQLAALTSINAAFVDAAKATYPRPLYDAGAHARAIRDRAPINIADVETDRRLPEPGRVTARIGGYSSFVAVPLVHHDEALGALGIGRSEPGGFTDDEIALLQTFADQAVIAIENVRLFTELQTRTQELTRSVRELSALGEVGQAISSTLDLETVLSTIVSRAVQLSGLDGGVVFEYDEAAEEFTQRVATETGGTLAEVRRTTRFRKGEGVLGRTAITLEPVQVPDITVRGAYESRLRENLIESGIRAILAVPMVREERLIGCLAVTRNQVGQFPSETIELLRTFATQSALAIQNARLFREIEEKSRQLEVASQHKSEFLANMSHELRTPLNAIIGFSEVLTDRMFGELNEEQEEYLKDIYASGTHLLSLINDILDLSKVEAGRMELELSDFHLPTALENALMLVRERAGRRSIALHTSIDNRLGEIQGDERKIRQVVLNLLSNAIKFTPEGGRIEVAAVPKDGSVEVSVSDTGVGIAPEDHEKVFEEFRQVGTAEKKAEGTGLGLTLCRKFIELHGGRIWVKSQVNGGSTFTFTIPVRRGE